MELQTEGDGADRAVRHKASVSKYTDCQVSFLLLNYYVIYCYLEIISVFMPNLVCSAGFVSARNDHQSHCGILSREM